MVSNIKCLCSGCSRRCNGAAKTELAMKGKLTYIYLRSGNKLTNSCTMFSSGPYKPLNSPVFLGREGLLKIV